MEKELLVVTMPENTNQTQRLAAQEVLTPLAESLGVKVLCLPHGATATVTNDRLAQAIEANTAAVLELCGLVAASFEQGQEEAYDAPVTGQTMNSPRRK